LKAATVADLEASVLGEDGVEVGMVEVVVDMDVSLG